MLLPTTGLESHPAGTTNVGGIINGNWERLEALFSVGLSTADPAYNAILKALVRNGTLPTDCASIEWAPDLGTPVMIIRPGVAALAGTTPTISFKGAKKQTLTLTGATTFSFSDLAAGREVEILITGDGSTRALTWPVGIKWTSAAGTSIPASKIGSVRLVSSTGAASGVYAQFSVAP